MPPALRLGIARPLDGGRESAPLDVPAHHLVTHGVVVGMTGSGKTGLVTVLVEEALRAQVPVLVVDVKGDLPNLLLSFPSFDPAYFEPWIDEVPESVARASKDNGESGVRVLAERLAEERRRGLEAFGLGAADLAAFAASAHVRVITPGADAGEMLHVLSSLERRSSRWDSDVEGARAALSAAISLILRLLGRDPDPARSREHVLLAVLAERRLLAGEPADIAALLPEVVEPPIATIGALDVNAFMTKKARRELAASLNTLLASPSFASWRQGATLDVASWMKPIESQTPATTKTPVTVLSVAHLDDDERALVLGVVLEEVLTWVRGLPGSQRLKALIVFDEVYGFLPPHPAAPPTKRPLVALVNRSGQSPARWTESTEVHGAQSAE